MSKILSLTERVVIPAGAEPPVERVVNAHVSRGFHRDGDALVRGTRIGSYLRAVPSKWRTTAVMVAERDGLTVTWDVDVSGQVLMVDEVDLLCRELQWTVSERASEADPPPDFVYDIGDTFVGMARQGPVAAVILLSMCLFCAWLGIGSVVREDIPPYHLLVSAAGEVERIQEQQGLVRFSLRGDPRVYVYNGKGGALGSVVRSLRSANGATASLRYAPAPITPLLGGASYEVWDMALDGRPVLTYAEARRAWHADNIVGVYVGAAFLLSCLAPIWLGARAFRRQRRRARLGGSPTGPLSPPARP